MLAALTGVLFFALAAIAWALTTNQVTYNAGVEKSGPNTPGSQPDNVAYNGVLAIRESGGGQPNTAPLTEIFFSKELKNNSKRFPACDEGDIDGQTEIPDKCRKAIVGGGTASALVGSPGSTNSIRQDLTVTAINGNKGRDILLALIGGAVTSYRTIPGRIEKLPDPVYGYKVGFEVPPELQGQLGTQIALTDFDVLIETERTVKVAYGPKPTKKQRRRGKKRKTYKASYLQLKKCPVDGLLPSRATVHFNNDDNSPGGQVVTHDSTAACPS
jgi:hypothetical protein